MATPLPLPKQRFLREVVLDTYVFVLICAPYFCWCLIRHRQWQWSTLAEFALIIALGSVLEGNIDYYGWRNRHQSSYRITPDRDEATPSCKPIDNRSMEI